MQIYVVRHGIAADPETGQPDADRPLTADGRTRFEEAVQGLSKLGVRIERVLHSPWRRARETAELLAPILEGPLEPMELLAEPPRTTLVKAIKRHAEEGPLAIVGHEPWLSELVALLILGETKSGSSFDLKKGGVFWLDGDVAAGKMRMIAYLPPRVLRAIR